MSKAVEFEHIFRWYVGIMFVFLGGMVVALLPLNLLIHAAAHATYTGDPKAPVVKISTAEKVTLIGVGMIILPFSAIVSGLYRSLLQSIKQRRFLLMLHILCAGAFGVMMAQDARGLIEVLAKASGDIWYFILTVAFWILSITYVCKVPWDQTRDAWGLWFDDFRKRFEPGTSKF